MSPPQATGARAALAIGGLLVFLLALPFAADLLDVPATTSLVTRMLIYAIAAASLNLVLGFGGMISFGHAAFYGIGGYAVGILFQHARLSEPLFGMMLGTEQFLIAMPVAIVLGGLAALVIGALALRTTGVQFIMITLAFAQMLYFLFVSLKYYGGDDGLVVRRRNVLFGLDMRDAKTFYFVVLALAAAYFAFIWRIAGSRFGMVLGAIRQNDRRVAAIGIGVYRYKLAAFVLAGMGAGLAGGLWANYARFVSPDMMHWTKSGELMVMVILGGAGTLFGPLFGAAGLITLETVLSAWTERWQFFLGPILILIILFFRGGLSGLVALFSGRNR
ncbi:MAG: branched-chain amino acid ABC transporter permease [Alphaproteobacteria bacterium]|nr:branched-chain amino acid ABC transporter permease [Alphaproteobacteria bacterium]